MKKYLITIVVFILSLNLIAQIDKNYISYETTNIISQDTNNYQLYMIGKSFNTKKEDNYKDIIDHLIRDKNVKTIFFDGNITDEWIMNQIKLYNENHCVKKILDRKTLKRFRKSFPYLVDIDKTILDSLQFYSLSKIGGPHQYLTIMSSILKKYSQFDAATEMLILQDDIFNIAEKDNYLNILDSIIKEHVGTEEQLNNNIGDDFNDFIEIFKQLKVNLRPFINGDFNFDSINIVAAEIIKDKLNSNNPQNSLIITVGSNLIDKKDLTLVPVSRVHILSTRLSILLPYKKCKIRHFTSKDMKPNFFPMLDDNIKLIQDIGKENKQYLIKLKFKDSPFKIDYDYIYYTK